MHVIINVYHMSHIGYIQSIRGNIGSTYNRVATSLECPEIILTFTLTLASMVGTGWEVQGES